VTATSFDAPAPPPALVARSAFAPVFAFPRRLVGQGPVGAAIGVAVLIGAWAVLARRQPELVLPSPAETARALADLVTDRTLFAELATTMRRAVTGVGLALVLGVAWGTINGRSGWAVAVSRPALSSLMALPPVVIVAVGMVWFGPGDGATRIVVVLVALPLIVITVQEAVRAIDVDLREMSAVFELSRRRHLRHVVAPGIASPALAAASVTLGQALRVTVMAELLSASDGVGVEVARSRANLATADLFAWALVLVAAVIAVELLLIRPVSARLLRWRTTPTNEEPQ